MSKWHVILAERAEADLRETYEHIAYTLLEPQIAKNVIQRIKKRVYKLEYSPDSYALYQKEPWKSRGLRRVNSGNYAIFFIPEEEKGKIVTVIRIMYGGRDIERILDDMVDNEDSEEAN